MGRRPCLGATDDAVGGALVALVRATAREAAREVAGAGCSRLGRRPEEGGRPTTNDWEAGGGGGHGRDWPWVAMRRGRGLARRRRRPGHGLAAVQTPRVAGVAPAGPV
jgi:hypothetical protein